MLAVVVTALCLPFKHQGRAGLQPGKQDGGSPKGTVAATVPAIIKQLEDGSCPEGTCPLGICPQGTSPDGTNPGGTNPGGTNPALLENKTSQVVSAEILGCTKPPGAGDICPVPPTCSACETPCDDTRVGDLSFCDSGYTQLMVSNPPDRTYCDPQEVKAVLGDGNIQIWGTDKNGNMIDDIWSDDLYAQDPDWDGIGYGCEHIASYCTLQCPCTSPNMKDECLAYFRDKC